MSWMFGGAARKKAAEAADVAQTRQLSTISEDTRRTAMIRRSPRGRKILADADRNQLSTTVA